MGSRSMINVVEGLASKCAKLSQSRGSEVSAAWTWLAENRPGGKEVQGEDAVEASWQLLEHIVSTEETKGCTSLHRVALTRLAGKVAIEYLLAVMGQGSEYFGLEGGLSGKSNPAWVPWTVLDRLFLELKENCNHSGVKNVLERLEGTVEKYLNLVETVSIDMQAHRAG